MNSPKNPEVQNFLDTLPHLQEAVWNSRPIQDPENNFSTASNQAWPLNEVDLQKEALLQKAFAPTGPMVVLPHVQVLPQTPQEKPLQLQGGSLGMFIRGIKAHLKVKDWFKSWRVRQVNAKFPRGTQYPVWMLDEAKRRATELLRDDDFLESWCKNLLTWDRPWGAAYAAAYLSNIAICASLNEIVMEAGLDEVVDGIVEDEPLPEDEETLLPKEDEEDEDDEDTE